VYIDSQGIYDLNSKGNGAKVHIEKTSQQLVLQGEAIMLHKAMFPKQHYHLSQGKDRTSKNPRHFAPMGGKGSNGNP
jgi:hypothetical protein